MKVGARARLVAVEGQKRVDGRDVVRSNSGQGVAAAGSRINRLNAAGGRRVWGATVSKAAGPRQRALDGYFLYGMISSSTIAESTLHFAGRRRETFRSSSLTVPTIIPSIGDGVRGGLRRRRVEEEEEEAERVSERERERERGSRPAHVATASSLCSATGSVSNRAVDTVRTVLCFFSLFYLIACAEDGRHLNIWMNEEEEEDTIRQRAEGLCSCFS